MKTMPTARCKYCLQADVKENLHVDEHTAEHYHDSCRPISKHRKGVVDLHKNYDYHCRNRSSGRSPGRTRPDEAKRRGRWNGSRFCYWVVMDWVLYLV